MNIIKACVIEIIAIKHKYYSNEKLHRDIEQKCESLYIKQNPDTVIMEIETNNMSNISDNLIQQQLIFTWITILQTMQKLQPVHQHSTKHN